MINCNLPRRIATKIESAVVKPFYYIEEKIEQSDITPFGFIWNITHAPSSFVTWFHFHVIRRDQLNEYLELQKNLNSIFNQE